MKTLGDIKRQLESGAFEFSQHAFRRVVERNISEQEIRELSANVEVIENYPNDKYSPGGLLLGFTIAGRALHLQVSYGESALTKIITIYEPDPNQWINYRKRK